MDTQKDTINPFYNHASNCASNVYSHTPYKPLQNWDYQQNNFAKIALLC
jgi:hypothetical protein